MSRSYINISMHEKEILRMKEEVKSLRQIGDKPYFTYEQIHNFICHCNEKQRKIAEVITIEK